MSMISMLFHSDPWWMHLVYQLIELHDLNVDPYFYVSAHIISLFQAAFEGLPLYGPTTLFTM